jgi:hypothetical protein
MGGIACMASDQWQELWQEEIFPAFGALGIDALYWDEGFGHQMFCLSPDHSHGKSALAVLSAQMRGARYLYKGWRAAAGPDSFLSCESGGDVQARHIDLWHYSRPCSSMRFTHPDKMIITEIDSEDVRGSVGLAFVYGCPLMLRQFMEGAIPLKGERLEALRAFVRLRQEMRARQVPGYPHRFRDEIGMNIEGKDLTGKIYSDSTGITVVYFSKSSCRGRIVVDGRRHCLPRLGVTEHSLRLKENQMGYLIIGT